MSETTCIAISTLPSPLGRGWTATGAFTSRRGPGEGSVQRREGIRCANTNKEPLTWLAIRPLTDHPLPKGEGYDSYFRILPKRSGLGF